MFMTTIKDGDQFRLASEEKLIGTVSVRRRKGQIQLVFELNGLTVHKTTQHEVRDAQCNRIGK